MSSRLRERNVLYGSNIARKTERQESPFATSKAVGKMAGVSHHVAGAYLRQIAIKRDK